MIERIAGRVYVAGEDVDTDAIIPASYMTTMDADKLGPHAMEGYKGIKENPFVLNDGKSPYKIIVSGKNFGSGSSREHAPIALYGAGVRAVIAPSFARIFYRSCVNGGLILPIESYEDLTNKFATGNNATINLTKEFPEISSGRNLVFSLKGFGPLAEIVEAGGLTAINKTRLGLAN